MLDWRIDGRTYGLSAITEYARRSQVVKTWRVKVYFLALLGEDTHGYLTLGL